LVSYHPWVSLKRVPFTSEQISVLKENYSNTLNIELAKILGRSPAVVQEKAIALGLKKSPEYRSKKSSMNSKKRHDAYTPKEDAYLIQYYPTMKNSEIAKILDRSPSSIMIHATRTLKLRKSKEAISKWASENNKGEKHHQFGKPLSLETRLKISEAGKGRKLSPEMAEKLRQACRKPRSEETKRRLSESHRGKPSWNKGKRLSETHLRRWLASNRIRPNKQEIELDRTIQEVTPNFRMNLQAGDFVIGGKIPDWVACDGQKKIIELFGDFWHFEKILRKDPNWTREKAEKLRKDHYSNFGFSTLIIWESELSNLDSVIRKISDFERGVSYGLA